MIIKKYLVKHLEDAIPLIKKDLGKDACILSRKKVVKRGKLNLTNVELIEVTAAVDPAKADPADISPALLNKTYEYYSPGKVQQRKEEVFSKMKAHPEITVNKQAVKDLSDIKNELGPLTREVAEIKKFLYATTNGFEGYKQFKGIFFDLYVDLVESGVEGKLSEKLIQTLQYQADADNISDLPSIKERLFNLITSSISLPSPLKPEQGKRKVVVMVGPTGSGKTTTIAKLCSYFKLMESKKAALITIDSYRIGAEAHLKTYADILDVPFYSVFNDREMRFRLDKLTNFDLIFVDTTGRSPNDKKGLLIMEKHLSAVPAQEKEVYLILSAPTKTADLYMTYEKFNIFQPDKFIFSKIDESLSLGNLFNLKMRTDIPAAYFTTGQRVPEDIEIAHPGTFARRVFPGYNKSNNKKGETHEYQ
ncbi:MAG: flagellar biosynthesis protein FlhF [Candidatus Aminicenantes bacterium]|nr:MAG: flagellar biosynthesis protein FlhF [Candidatus Aminicenantes bacterium]